MLPLVDELIETLVELFFKDLKPGGVDGDVTEFIGFTELQRLWRWVDHGPMLLSTAAKSFAKGSGS